MWRYATARLHWRSAESRWRSSAISFERKALSHREVGARARCIVAGAEIALASRDLGWSAKEVDAAREARSAQQPIQRRARARGHRPRAPRRREHAAVLAFLPDGESWSSSALALALGTSQRTVHRALDSLAAAGKVQSFSRARALRWMTPPLPGIATTLLLPARLAID